MATNWKRCIYGRYSINDTIISENDNINDR